MTRPFTAADVAVIIPAHNEAEFIGRALTCVQGQTAAPAEIVVIDDASTDDTAQIARSFAGVTVIEQENTGVSQARNNGIDACQGSVIAFLDADDLWPSDAIERQLEVLNSRADAGIVRGLSTIMLKNPEGEFAPTQTRRLATVGSALITREAYTTVGPFAPGMQLGEDIDWFLRADEAEIVTLNHDAVTLYYHRHSGNVSGDMQRNASALLQRVREARKRREGGA